MSVEEDTELRDLISQTLQANGCFAKIRAQLRASIYMALDEDDTFQKKEFLQNKKLHAALETVEGKLMFCIVREFLEHFDLEFTISVFEPESYLGLDYEYAGRYKLIEDLNIPNLNQESSVPVLLQLLQLHKLSEKSESPHTESSVSSLNYKNDLLSQNSYNENSSIIQVANDSDLSNKQSSGLVSNNPFNETFDVKAKSNVEFSIESPVSVHNHNDVIDRSKLQQNQDLKDKFLIHFDNSLQNEIIFNKNELEKNKPLDQPSSEIDFSPPVVKDNKFSKFDTSFDKLKLSSPKSDKIKVKNNLSSLSDLPPLQMTKSRTNDMLLPSLYTKEFKDKSNTKDVDKLFELEPLDNYEEDFISENEMSVKSNHDEISKQNSLIESQVQNMANKNVVTDHETSLSFDTYDKKKVYLDNNSTASSVTSEDFEINSNVDDILNSC